MRSFMKNAIISLIIVILIAWVYFTIHLPEASSPLANQTPNMTGTQEPSFPEADYSEAITPSGSLPQPEEVSLIDEEH